MIATNFEDKDACALIKRGKSFALEKNFENAVEEYQRAIKILTQNFGDTADECGEVYLLYGTALLELSRANEDFLGEKVNKESLKAAQDIIEEKSENETDCSNIENENLENSEIIHDNSENEKSEDEHSGEYVDDAIDQTNENQHETAGDAHDITQDGGQTSKSMNEEENDITQLQIAWETLELARIIFSRKDSFEYQSSLCEVKLALGQICMESDRSDIAFSELNDCYQILQNIVPPDCRRLAEVLYHIGIVKSMESDFESSLDYYSKAKSILQLRLNNITDKLNSNNSDDEKQKIIDEIDDLKALLPDLDMKIDECKESSFNQNSVKEMLTNVIKDVFGSQENNVNKSELSEENKENCDDKPHDISHLIKKKRKTNEGSFHVEESTIKCSKLDDMNPKL